MSDPQQEYAEALAAYRDAMARLQEAKRHIPPSPRDRFRQRKREERAAERAHYEANKEAIDAENAAWTNRIIAKALATLHQKVNAVQLAEDVGMRPGQSLRIRQPVTYTVSTGDDDE